MAGRSLFSSFTLIGSVMAAEIGERAGGEALFAALTGNPRDPPGRRALFDDLYFKCVDIVLEK